jgi:hypothetical protein
VNTDLRAVDPEAISTQCWAAIQAGKHRSAQSVASSAPSFRLGMLHACSILNERVLPGDPDFLARYRDWKAVYDVVSDLQRSALA